MVPSLVIALYLDEDAYRAFALAIVVTAIVGAILARLKVTSTDVGYREGFLIATGGWLCLTLFGTLPFMISGSIPGFINAFFETMSGFTTTGATVLTDVEILPKSILFWRSLTQWLGGIGIIVLTLALIPSLKIAGMKLFRAEIPGPAKSKALPRVAQTSRELYRLYIILTVIQIMILKLLGLSWFDSIIHTFASVATGGFSSYNASIGAFANPAVQYTIIFFMLVCGMNFALLIHALRGNLRPFGRDSELRVYLLVVVSACLFITVDLVANAGCKFEEALRLSAFQSVSIMTTTGYITDNYAQWPFLSQAVILVLMFIGGCAGSTSGGIKVVRHMILFKTASRQDLILRTTGLPRPFPGYPGKNRYPYRKSL